MPVPLPNKLRRAARETQYDPLEPGVFALPDLKTVLEELSNIRVARSRVGEPAREGRGVPHAAKHEDPARAVHVNFGEVARSIYAIEFSASGLRRSEFCRMHGITHGTLQRGLRRELIVFLAVHPRSSSLHIAQFWMTSSARSRAFNIDCSA